jgi:hypothetical protein
MGALLDLLASGVNMFQAQELLAESSSRSAAI